MNLRCEKSTQLTGVEKAVFARHLEAQGLSGSIWDLFGDWVARATREVGFFYLKVFRGADLIGLALFVELCPFDLRSSYAALRGHSKVSRLAGALSTVAGSRVYLSFRNLITANLTRPFFYRDPESADEVMAALLAALRADRAPDMVTVIDTTEHDPVYRGAGFASYPAPSEAYLDATRYTTVADYLADHRSLEKNLKRRRKLVTTQVKVGPVTSDEIAELRACVDCSVEHSRVNNPCQEFFESNIFATTAYRSNDYVHILVRVGEIIAGFHTFQRCGAHLGGVLGGFNRDHARNNFLYERVIVSSLAYAIEQSVGRVHYSLIDNLTKLRLVDSREPCALYFWSRSRLKRKLFELTYRYGDICELSSLESR